MPMPSDVGESQNYFLLKCTANDRQIILRFDMEVLCIAGHTCLLENISCVTNNAICVAFNTMKLLTGLDLQVPNTIANIMLHCFAMTFR